MQDEAKSISEAVSKSLSQNDDLVKTPMPESPAAAADSFKPEIPRGPLNKLESDTLEQESPARPENEVPLDLPGATPIDDKVSLQESIQSMLPTQPVEPAKPVQPPARPAPIPVVKMPVEPPAQQITKPITPPIIQPDVQPTVQPVAQQPIVQPIVKPAVQPVSQPIVQPPIQPPIQPVIKPAPKIFTKPVPPPPAPPTPPANHPSSLKNIRTYAGDVADVLAQRGSSRASMAIAESVKRGQGETLSNVPVGSDQKEEGSHFASKMTLLVVSLFLIGAGMVGGYYLYIKSPLGATAPVSTAPLTPPALVPYDSQAVISVDGLDRPGILRVLKTEMAKTQNPGSIKEIVLTEIKNAVTYRVSSLEASDIMQIPTPDMILRTLGPEWMLGVYASSDGNSKSAFVVVTTNLFQNAFSGMLGWEGGMQADLKDFLAATNQGTSTQALTGKFEDQIIKNKDARALVTGSGDTALVYSFIDNSTLVVAANSEALAAIISRLENKAFVR